MKPVRAQFVRRWEPSRRWWLGCLILLALAAGVAWLAWQSAQRTSSAKLEATRIEEGAQQVRTTAPKPSAALPPPYDTSAREMFAQSTVAWPTLLAALEAVSVSGVRLVSVDYVAAESRARVEITFTNHAAALEYVQALSAGIPDTGPAWRWRPLLLSQPRVADRGSASLEAVWQVR